MCQLLIDQKFMKIWWLLKYVVGLIKHQNDTSYSCQPFFMPLIAHSSFVSFEIMITGTEFYWTICPYHSTILSFVMFLKSIKLKDWVFRIFVNACTSLCIFFIIPRKTSRLLNMNIILLWRQRVVSCRDSFVTFLQ